MIYLENETEIGTCIALSETENFILNENEVDRKICGLGGVIDDGTIIGIFYSKERFFLVIDKKIIHINEKQFECYNDYINKKERKFVIRIDRRIVYEKVYIPFIDPGILYYDAELDEFDYLLQFYNMMKDKVNLFKYIKNLSS